MESNIILQYCDFARDVVGLEVRIDEVIPTRGTTITKSYEDVNLEYEAPHRLA